MNLSRRFVAVLLIVLALSTVVAPQSAFAEEGYWCDENGCTCWETHYELVWVGWFWMPVLVYNEWAC